MTVTVWQFLFNTEVLSQGNVKFQRAAILSCDISLSEIYGINLLKPNDIYVCRTAALTSRRYILNIYSTNIHTELNMLHNLRFFLFKMPFISYCCLVWFLYYSHFTYSVC